MKNYTLLLIVFCFGISAKAQIINFADANLKLLLVNAASSSSNQRAGGGTGGYFRVDANYDYEIDVNEALQVISLELSGSSIASLSGIEYFSNLETFTLMNSNAYAHTDVDVHELTHLKTFAYVSGLSDATINVSGLANLTSLNIRGTILGSLNLSGLTNIETLNCDDCGLTSLDLSGVPNIAFLRVLNSPLITSLPLNGNQNLRHVWISNTSVTTIDVSELPNLNYLILDKNQLTSLNIAGADNLSYLICSENQLTALNLSANLNLSYIDCSKNQLTALDVSANPLYNLSCSENQLTDLDLSHSTFENVWCDSNNLVSLNLKNNFYDGEVHSHHGQSYGHLEFGNNPNLQYICIDEIETNYVQSKITQYGYTNCHTNGYCTFNPGGTFYTVSGNTKYDADADGCDENDLVFPNLKFDITDGTTSGSMITDVSGNYNIPVQAGTHTIKPMLESPSYFTVTPPNIVVTFPATASTFNQDFCIAPNGIHRDSEASMIPITPARPGFTATYKILYKNKGNQPLSGTVSLASNASVLRFLSANVAPSSQPMNYINWDFTNLQPFETKEILVTFKVNSPTEMPPVNSGFILNYTLCINTGTNEETPADNIFILNQTVINSLDPNDKVCLEGHRITPEMIGKDVHYMIRFENTGTAAAENIVVKDIIDTTKFEITSLVPIVGSHPFVTKISKTNTVEFIFENINLPFDDANNDGYVVFKIKTKPSLTLGDSFSNSASIYFDYNAPVVTDPAVTAIQLLANEDFNFNAYCSIAPNPVKDVLNISTKENIQLSSISIYNLLGQLVITVPNPQKTIDVSGLKTGNYLIKVVSDQGIANTKFIKE